MASNGRLSAYPAHPDPQKPYSDSWFLYSFPPGTTYRDELVVENTTSDPISVRLYGVDATSTTDGAFAMRNEEDARQGVGSWITLDKDKLTVGPKQKEVVRLTVKIPDNVTIGDHVGGVIVQEDRPQLRMQDGVQIAVIPRLGVRVYESVPGVADVGLRVSKPIFDWKDGQLHAFLPLENTGNVLISVNGKIVIHNALWQRVGEVPIEQSDLQPASPILVEIPTEISEPIFNVYTLQTSLSYTGRDITKDYYQSNFLLKARWDIVVALVLGISVGVLAWRKIKKRRHQRRRAILRVRY